MSRRGNRGGIAGRLGRGYRVNAQPQEEDSWDDEEEGSSSQEHTTDVDEDYPNGHDAEYESFAEFMDRRGYEDPPGLGQLWQQDWEFDIDDDVFSGDSAVDSDGSEESSATSASSERETDESAEEDTEDDIQTPSPGPSNANPASVRGRNEEEEDMDDEIQVVIPTPGPSNANPVHVGEGNENEPPGRHRPHSSGDSSDSDMELNVRRPKRRRQEIQSQDEESPQLPPEEQAPAAAPVLDDDDDEDNCTICYEDFTTSGEHRLVSLKCGHFFGRNCIERWIRAEGRGAVCPTCKGRAALKDVRVHFSKNIKLADNSELVQLRTSNQDYRRRVDALEMDKARLERELKETKNQLKNGEMTAMPRLPSVVRSGRMRLFPGARGSLSLNPSVATYSRAFDFNGEYFAIGVHHPGTMFKPFAVRRVAFEGSGQMKIHSTIPLHQNRCRLVAFSPFESSTILSAGEDRRAVVHNTLRNNTTQEWKMPGDKQVWGGCWISETRFVVGLQDGRVYEYDMSSESTEPVRDVTQGIGRFAIISIVYDTESKMLLVTSFKSVVAFCGDRAFTLLSHDRDGFDKIQSFAWDPRSLSFVTTFAPSTAENRPRTISHKLFRVDISENSEVSCTEVGVWVTPHVKTTTMWNNCLFSLDDGVYFLAFCEDSKTIEAYDFSKKRPSVMLSFSGNDNVTAMKVLPGSKGQCRTIAILTEKNLSLVQFRLVDD